MALDSLSTLALPCYILFSLIGLPARSTLFPYTTLFRSCSVLHRWLRRSRRRLARRLVCFQGGMSVICFRSEEHTSELQSHSDLVCRLLLEKKNPAANSLEDWAGDSDRHGAAPCARSSRP